MNANSFGNKSYGRDITHHIVKLITAFMLLSFAVSTQNVAGDSKGSQAVVLDAVYFSNLTNDIDNGIKALNNAVMKADRTPKKKLLAEIKVLKNEVDKAISQYKRANPSKLTEAVDFEEHLHQYYVQIFYFLAKAQVSHAIVNTDNSTSDMSRMNQQLIVVAKRLENRFLAMASSLNNLKSNS